MALGSGTEVREPRAWLYRIVHNSALNVLRSSPDLLRPLKDAEELASGPVGGADLDQRMAALHALSSVAALPALQRQAILMSAVDGRSHEEVASALGVSDGAVRGLLYRARVTLRAAAAALAPQPLVGWVSSAVTRPGATRAGELCAQSSGSDVGPALLKGAAVAVTAAVLAAGVAEVHVHGRSASRPHPVLRAAAPAAARAPAEPVPAGTRTSYSAPAAAPVGTPVSFSPGQPAAGRARPSAPAGPAPTAPQSAPAPAAGQPPVSPPSPAAAAVPPAANPVAGSGATPSEPPAAGSAGAGTSGPSGEEEPVGTQPQGSGSGDGAESQDSASSEDGSSSSGSEHGAGEREAEHDAQGTSKDS